MNYVPQWYADRIVAQGDQDVQEALEFIKNRNAYAAVQALSGTSSVHGMYMMGVAQYMLHNDALATSWFERAARCSLGIAEYAYGMALKLGHGIPVNQAGSIGYLQSASIKGVVEATYELSCSLRNGLGIEKNTKNAMDHLMNAANRDLPAAQRDLAICYLYGNGIIRDPPMAVTYFNRAADQDDVDAINFLGYCYYNGIGVRKDRDRARGFFTRAAARGHPSAILNVSKSVSGGIKSFEEDAAHHGVVVIDQNKGCCSIQ